MLTGKHLILVSSGKSVTGDEFENILKPLTGDGAEEIRQTATSFSLKNILPDKIIASTEENARQSAGIVAEKINFPPNLIFKNSFLFECNEHDLIFQYLKHFERTCQCLMLVAQAKVFSELASFLCFNLNVKLHCGSILGLEFKVKEWSELTEDSGKLLFYLRPA